MNCKTPCWPVSWPSDKIFMATPISCGREMNPGHSRSLPYATCPHFCLAWCFYQTRQQQLKMVEIKNIGSSCDSVTAPSTYLQIEVRGLSTPNSDLSKIKDVLTLIASFEPENWPNDNVWETGLPSWFVKFTKNISIENISMNANLWHFESWLDAIRFRGWRWHCSIITIDGFTIILETINYPYVIEPFFYILYSLGISQNQISFYDSTGNYS